MLDPFTQLFQHCWGHARSLRMDYKDLWVVFFPRCAAGPKLAGSCCVRLHAALVTRFFGGNVVRVLVHFSVSLPLIFTLHSWSLPFLILSAPLQNFHVVLPAKKCLLCFFFFISLAKISVALFLVELRLPSAHFLFSSVFLLLYILNLWT